MISRQREAPRLESEKQRDWFFWRQKRGVVVAGHWCGRGRKSCAVGARTSGWPLIGDVLSQTGRRCRVPIFCQQCQSDQ
ncbi:hypothetical protein ACLB1E_16805 [Escherichia coli]